MNSLSRHELEMLARYNTRVSEGVMHSPEYKAQMFELKQRFDWNQRCKHDCLNEDGVCRRCGEDRRGI